MIYRKMSNSGDYVFGNSSKDFLKDADAVQQAVLTNLKLLKGEWWEDTEKGLPLFNSILGQRGTPENLNAIQMLVTDNILSVENVTSIDKYAYSFDTVTRQYTANCLINTAYGSIQIGVTL